MSEAEIKSSDSDPARGSEADAGEKKSFMLFGVKVMTEGSFRKSASMNNLAQFDQPPRDSNTDDAGGYDSDDVVHPCGRSRERKRGVPWSEEEHRLFLLGLQRVGKGDWRGISRNFVKTRTPTQVASHAQKYFLRRRNSHIRRRRRSSLFDITTDTVMGSKAEDPMLQDDFPEQQNNVPIPSFPVVINPVYASGNHLTLCQLNQLNNSPKPIRPIPILPPSSSKLANLNLNKTTTTTDPSLSLSITNTSQPSQEPPPSSQPASPARHVSAFQAMPGPFKGNAGDGSFITVA